MTNVYYYEELKMSYIDKVKKAIEARMVNGVAWLDMKNGKEIGVQRVANGDVRVYEGCDLISEFSDKGYNEYCSGYAMFNATVFIIRMSK